MYQKILTVILKIIIFKDKKIVSEPKKPIIVLRIQMILFLTFSTLEIEFSLPSNNKFHAIPYGHYYIDNFKIILPLSLHNTA